MKKNRNSWRQNVFFNVLKNKGVFATRRCEKKNERLGNFLILAIIFDAAFGIDGETEPPEKRRHMINIYGGKARRQEAISEKRKKDGIF